MRPGDLDDKYLPQLAERVAALADRLAARWGQLAELVGRGRSVSLQELDIRYAGSGPLAIVRDVPQIGFVVIAAVFLAGTATLVSKESARNRAAQQQTVSPGVTPTTPQEAVDRILGPAVGQRTNAYEGEAAATLARALAGKGDSTRVALVSFSAYRTPAQVSSMLNGYTVRRVWLRAPAAGKEATEAPVEIRGTLLGDLRTAYARTAAAQAKAHAAYQRLFDTLTVTTKEEQLFADEYARYARATGLEAAAYRGSCACVFAAVVEVPAARLLVLRARPAVRVVEAAADGLALRQLEVVPLRPDVKGVVPKPLPPVEPP